MAEIIEPESETQLKKEITEEIYQALETLREPTLKVIGYVGLAKLGAAVNKKSFGLSRLLKCINDGNAEGAVNYAHVVSQNIGNYKEKLTEKGLTEAITALFTSIPATITQKKVVRKLIEENRATIVEANVGFFNQVYEIFTEVLAIGKIIAKLKKSPAMLKKYTQKDILNAVRKSKKAEDKNPVSDTPTGSTNTPA